MRFISTALVLTIPIVLSERVLTVLIFLTELVLTVLMFLTELVLTVLVISLSRLSPSLSLSTLFAVSTPQSRLLCFDDTN